MSTHTPEPPTTAVALRNEQPSAVEVSPELSIEEVIRRRKLIERLMREEVLVEGRHFGKVKGIAKPFLWQAGAELICQLFRFRPEYQHMIERRFEPPYYEVTSTCRLYHIGSSVLVGEAVGVANSLEKRGWNQAPFGFANAILKMADKRAHNSAAKSATAASDFFSVDEDQVDQVEEDRPAPARQRAPARAGGAPPTPTTGHAPAPAAAATPADPMTKRNPIGGLFELWKQVYGDPRLTDKAAQARVRDERIAKMGALVGRPDLTGWSDLTPAEIAGAREKLEILLAERREAAAGDPSASDAQIDQAEREPGEEG